MTRPKARSFDEYITDLHKWEDERHQRQVEEIRQELSGAGAKSAREVLDRERRSASTEAMFREAEERMARGRKKYKDWDQARETLNEFPMERDMSKPDFMRDLILRHPQGDEIAYYLGKNPDDMDALIEPLFEIEDGVKVPLLTNSMMEVLLDSASPVALLRHLARNPDERQEIADMHPRKALRVLALLDSKLSAGANNGSPGRVRQVSNAPPPPSHRAGGHRNVGAERSGDDDSLDEGSTNAYLAQREREERQKRQRRSA